MRKFFASLVNMFSKPRFDAHEFARDVWLSHNLRDRYYYFVEDMPTYNLLKGFAEGRNVETLREEWRAARKKQASAAAAQNQRDGEQTIRTK